MRFLGHGMTSYEYDQRLNAAFGARGYLSDNLGLHLAVLMDGNQAGGSAKTARGTQQYLIPIEVHRPHRAGAGAPARSSTAITRCRGMRKHGQLFLLFLFFCFHHARRTISVTRKEGMELLSEIIADGEIFLKYSYNAQKPAN